MSHDANTQTVSPHDQRLALQQSEKDAAAQQPDSYAETANEEKLVEIGNDVTDNPIHGLDPVKTNTQDTARNITHDATGED